MDKFWFWMGNKHYAGLFGKYYYLIHGNYVIEKPQKQMLIGYMIEYLAENGRFVGLASGVGFESIKDYYSRLEKTIENLKEI